jgi:hypothetical protein
MVIPNHAIRHRNSSGESWQAARRWRTVRRRLRRPTGDTRLFGARLLANRVADLRLRGANKIAAGATSPRPAVEELFAREARLLLVVSAVAPRRLAGTYAKA